MTDHPPHLLATPEDVETAVGRSFVRPIVIFKHSVTCGISAQAMDEIAALHGDVPIDADVYVVHVRASRAASDALSEQFRLRHESPQVLVIRNGVLIWHASHFRVTTEAIAAAVAQSEKSTS